MLRSSSCEAITRMRRRSCCRSCGVGAPRARGMRCPTNTWRCLRTSTRWRPGRPQVLTWMHSARCSPLTSTRRTAPSPRPSGATCSPRTRPRAFGKRVAAHNRASLQPSSKLLPLLLYNLSAEDRAQFTQRMPRFVVDGLVPVAFRPQWRHLRPFMAHPPARWTPPALRGRRVGARSASPASSPSRSPSRA